MILSAPCSQDEIDICEMFEDERDEELSLVVTMLRADSCDALRRGDTSTMQALDEIVRRLEAGEHRR